MKAIQIANQPGPGPRRLIRITADGIRYRLFRSMVTLAVVATAIAFLMNMVTEGLIRRSIGTEARAALQERHLIHIWLARLRQLPEWQSEQALLEALAGGTAVQSKPPKEFVTVQNTLAGQASRLIATHSIEQYLQIPEIKQLLAGRLNILPAEVTPALAWRFLNSPSATKWLCATTAERSLPPPPRSPAELVLLAQDYAVEAQLTTADRQTVEIGSGFLGLGTRMVWLLLVSLLVCTIGITNAMLMSVTERFREIATMKCLGALDGVIMGIFVLESCLLGLTGGAIGAVAGVVIGTTRSLSSLGWMFFRQLPVLDLLGAVGLAMVVGLILSAVAAVYPAWQAARLAPMEAMRIQ